MSSFHEPLTLAIDVDRSLHLHAIDPSWTAWLGPRLSEAVHLEALDESLTRWLAHHKQFRDGDVRRYAIPITTPPGKPEWLTECVRAHYQAQRPECLQCVRATCHHPATSAPVHTHERG